jgi:hypothetical protein
MRARWELLLTALLLSAVVGGAAGYELAAHRSNVSILTGSFYVGDHQAYAQVDGWAYGISDGVSWLDAKNSWHDRGWPACLGPVGTTHTLRFGYTVADGPTGESWRQVVWVSCLT